MSPALWRVKCSDVVFRFQSILSYTLHMAWGKKSKVTWYSAVLYLLKGILMDFWYPCWLLFINFGVVKSSLRQAWGTWCSLVWAASTEDHVFNSHGGRNPVKILVWWVMTHLWVWQSHCSLPTDDTQRHITACSCRGANWSFLVLLLFETHLSVAYNSVPLSDTNQGQKFPSAQERKCLSTEHWAAQLAIWAARRKQCQWTHLIFIYG